MEISQLSLATPFENVFTCFARQAAASAQMVAVIDEQGQTTYEALAARADAVAHYLLANGLTAEQPVGVLMSRRTEMLAVLLGVWKAGGAYVPFDPEEPATRIRQMQSSCGIALVVGDKKLLLGVQADYREAGCKPPVFLDTNRIQAPAADTEPLVWPEGGARLAYLLFTSGTTGEPKAVEVEHRQVLALLKSASELLEFSPRDRYLAASTIAFDASITELFLPLVTGASLVLRDRNILLDPHRMAREIREHQITVVQTGPSVWQVMLDGVQDFPHVRVVITHGEAVTPELARRIAGQGENAWNLYGPTETTVWALAQKLAIDDPPGLSGSSAPIGQPLAHLRAWVLDEQGKPVPDGTAGELYLGGTSVARGYRNNQKLTQERFVTIDEQRCYGSGDVVIRDERGIFHYFGRNDEQLKIRGVRIEPGEIEAALLLDPRVAQAAVTWFYTALSTRAIVAAVVLTEGAGCRAQDIHSFLAERLPATMIPSRFLFMQNLPSTTSGKVDRKTIRQSIENTEIAEDIEAATGISSGATAGKPARMLTYTERALSRIWSKMLRVTSIAHDDHFFSIGGDSLTAVQVMVEAEARFGMVLPVHLVFEAPTLEELALRIDRAKQSLDDELSTGFVFPLSPVGDDTPIFFSGVELSLARRNVWTVPCTLFAIVNWVKGSGFVHGRSLESLAGAHLESIRQIQPRGPYRLAGYSLGGLIAYEMAQQLLANGEVVELLFLLDPMAPNLENPPELENRSSPSSPAVRRDPISVRVRRHLQRVMQGPSEAGLGEWLRMSLLIQMMPRIRRPNFIDWLYYLAVNQYLRHPNAASRLIFPRNRWRAFWFAAQRMIAGYRARPYDGPLLAVFCQQGPRGEVWHSLLGQEAQRFNLDAQHHALFEEPAIGQWMDWVTVKVRELDKNSGGDDRVTGRE